MGIIQTSRNFDVSWLMGRSTTVPHRSLLRRLFPKRILFAAALVAAFPCLLPQAVGAQTLDQAIANQLNNDCAVLTGGGSAAGLSTELNSICSGSNGTSGGGASGGGTGGSQSLGATVENRRQDRLEGKPAGNQATLNLPSGLGLFISGNVEALDRDKTTFADGFDSTVWGAAIGGDYRFNDRLLAGGAFTYTNRNGDFDGGGDFSTNSWGLLAYGSFIPMPAMFLDLTLGYTGHSYLVKRPVEYVEGGSGDTIGGKSSSNAAGNEFLIRAVTGYDHTIGNVTIGPRVGMNYSRLAIDDFTEDGGGGLALSYDNQTIQSLQSTVGLQVSAAINTSYGVWVPQATAPTMSMSFKMINDPFASNLKGINAHPPKVVSRVFPSKTTSRIGTSTILVSGRYWSFPTASSPLPISTSWQATTNLITMEERLGSELKEVEAQGTVVQQ